MNNGKVYTQGYFVRKSIYTIASVAFLVLTGFGVITAAQADTLLATVDTSIVPAIATIITALAASKTHPGSDSKATEADVDAARAQVAAELAPPEPVHLPTYDVDGARE